ncbi:hypothetical protein EX30DRAFT_350599 [Ascodesmis nigricans]|uniref:Uncharacterized protein n=1 Tax=Ascodesmis nigricans TaxID=341454 RepID=A0A4S2MPK0_9PEZI|nr:hypothetical protein EX30DRAFT_350599 [Ascodesmis nigricans]
MATPLKTTEQNALLSVTEKVLKGLARMDEILGSVREGRRLDSTISGLKSDDPVRKKLSVLSEILDLSEQTPTLFVEHIPDGGVPNLAQFISKSFENIKDDNFRASLFFAAPTAVILSLIRSNQVTVPPAIRTDVIEILDAGARKGFNMNTDPFRVLEDLVGSTSDDAIAFVQKLYRLQALVKDAKHINNLLSAGYGSAHAIANTEYNKFINDENLRKLDKDTVARIYDHAVGIETSNEQTWVAFLRARGAMRVAAIDDITPPPQALTTTIDDQKDGAPFKFVDDRYSLDAAQYKSDEKLAANFANLFQQFQTDECPDCMSITSYGAYLVDLLQLLEDTKYNDPFQPHIQRSLMENLRYRRPDLEHLELSCANTNSVLQYIDLANEIMESLVGFMGLLDARTVVPYNESAQETCSSGPASKKMPANINYQVYQQFLSKQVYPMNIFPWNQATQSIDLYCKNLGVPRAQLLDKAPLLWRVTDIIRRRTNLAVEDAKKLACETLVRAKSAAYLGLQEQDYVAITHESFYPQGATSLSQIEYRENVGLRPPREYWGYPDHASMINETPDEYDRISGLQDVLRQLLPRSNISFSELLALLKTRYLSRRLTLQSASANPREFSGRIKDMRLRTPVPDSTGSTLNPAICDDVQRFIRLWKRIGWTVDELDETLIVLAPGVDNCHTSGITPAMVNELAAVKELSDITGEIVPDLLPLWSDIGLEFFRQRFVASNFNIFAADKAGRYLTANRKISDHAQAVLLCLDIPIREFVSMEALGLEDKLDMVNLSALRQRAMLSGLLKISLRDLPALLQAVNTDGETPFQSPSSTLRFLAEWRSLSKAGFNIAKVSITTGYSQPLNLRVKALKACTAVLRGLDEIETLQSFQAPSTGDQGAQRNIARQMILDVVNADFPIVDTTIVHHLLTDVVKGGMTRLERMNYLDVETADGGPFEGYFMPPTTEGIIFTSMDVGESDTVPKLIISEEMSDPNEPTATGITLPTLSVDGVALECSQSGNVFSFAEQRYTKGQIYRLSFSGNVKHLRWNTSKSEPTSLGKKTLIEGATVESLETVYTSLERAAEVVSTFKLTLEELRFASLQWRKASANSFRIDFSKPSFQDLCFLRDYIAVRDACPQSIQSSNKLLELYKWAASTPKGSEFSEIAEKIAEHTGWPLGEVTEILKNGYPGLRPADFTAIILDGQLLRQISTAIKLVTDLAVPSITTAALCNFVEPRFPDGGQTTAEFESAAQLRRLCDQSAAEGTSNANTRLSEAYDKLRVAQRTALVHYLLQQPFFINKKIYDADALFEFLLIDVQMGACLETSRMKNAISTIQLFVHRCLQGLEKNHGIPAISIVKRWEYTRSYPLWEANRRVFLYPENYIDPTLRDNKTDLFKNLEAAIMQRDISMKNIGDAIKAYIHGAHDMGDLDIVTYLWDRTDDDNGIFHFFARTRMAPYKYYHRMLEVKTLIGGMVPYFFWSPWAALELDIPVMEVDLDGTNVASPGIYLIPALQDDRLHLFIPQLTLKTVPPKPQGSVKAMAESDPDKSAENPVGENFWELRMGWSEFRKGVWSAKQISQNALEIKAEPAPDLSQAPESLKAQGEALIPLATALPRVDSFRFSLTRRADDILVINVHKLIRPTVQSSNLKPLSGWKLYLGGFELRGQHLVKLPSVATEKPALAQRWLDRLSPSPYTSFMKLRYDKENAVAPKDIKDGKSDIRLGLVEKADAFSLTKDAKPAKALNWTMTFDYVNNQQPYGHVLEVDNGDRSQTYFALVDEKEHAETRVYDIMKHTLSPELMKAAAVGGVEDVFEIFKKDRPLDDSLDVYGRRNGPIYHEQSTPYAQYNWELGVHTVMLMMERLLALQQFDQALQVAHLVFDPRATGTNVNNCWVFEPFRDRNLRLQQSFEIMVKELHSSTQRASNGRLRLMGIEWRANPFNPHAIARMSPVAYMKRIVMKYIEILIASGDYYFRQNSLESLPLAIQQYVQASHVFGPAPHKVPKLGKTVARSYRDIQRTADDLKRFRPSTEGLSNAAVDLDLAFPFFSPPNSRGSRRMRKDDSTSLFGFLATSYFCVPANPQFTSLRTTIGDRLFKLRHCLDINGNPRRLSLFEPKIDPMALVQAAASGRLSASIMLNDADSPMPNYRFVYLLQKALELCGEMKNLQAHFLAAKEKTNAEELAVLKSKQEVVINGLVLDMKMKQREEAVKAIDALLATRKTHEHRLEFYLRLIGENTDRIPTPAKEWTDIDQAIDHPVDKELKMSSYEQTDLEMSEKAAQKNMIASGMENGAAWLLVLPRFTTNIQPFGMGTSFKLDSHNVARASQAAAGTLRCFAQDHIDQGARAAKKSGLIRQLQDRRLQANLAGREIKAIDEQIAVQKARIAICDSDLRLQHQQIAYAQETQNWLQSKYTNVQLYTWFDHAARNLLYQTYLLTNDLAVKAQKAFKFERPTDKTIYLQPGGHWDSARDGLLSAESIQLGLKRLESAYISTRAHHFDVTKNISLRQIYPAALFDLRTKGTAEFSLPEVLFDMDFPGHYCRRIKAVSVSIPCIVGPYTGVNATLSLLRHQYRVSPEIKDDADYLPKKAGGEITDDRFRADVVPINAIALSSGQHDSGVFELNFNGERFGPFEGAGVISDWKLELAMQARQFDYMTISDVIIQLKYTSLNGGDILKSGAINAVKLHQQTPTDPAGSFLTIDIKNEFSNEWFAALDVISTTALESRFSVSIPITDLKERLPCWARLFPAKSLRAEEILVYVATEDGEGVTMKLDEDDLVISWAKAERKEGMPPNYEVYAKTGTEVSKKLFDEEWRLQLVMEKRNAPESVVMVVRYSVAGQ